jgi:hypothetical protein
MKRFVRVLLPVLVVAILLSGCFPAAATPTPYPTLDQNTIVAVAIETLQALATQQALLIPTGTPLPTSTPYVITATPQPTFTPTLTPIMVIPCDMAAFIGDVTIPDGTVMAPGQTFIKTWRLENVGSCTWTPAYQVIFDHGALMGGPSSINLPAFVAPGQTIDISVTLTAPANSGTYEGFWKLRDSNGFVFGVGATGQVPFEELIVVGTTPLPFAVMHVLQSVNTQNVTAQCPPGFTFTFYADIFTNGPGTVTYYWIFSDGTQTAEASVNFSSAGDQVVSTTWALGTSGALAAGNPFSGYAEIYIDNPNHQNFGKINFSLTCTSP